MEGNRLLAPEARGYLRLLEGLEAMKITADEGAVVARIARFVDAPRVISKVASVAKWYSRWEIREALYQNAATPESLREPLGLSIAVIDLMREMAAKGLTEAARNEIREDIRSLLRQLPSVDRDVVKAHAHTLASGGGMTAAAPLDDAAAQLAEEATAATVTEAAVTEGRTRLAELLADARERVRRSALENPNLDETALSSAASTTTEPAFLSELMTTPRWSLSDAVRRVVAANPATPAAIRTVFATTDGVMLSLGRYFNEPLESDARATLAKDILAEIQELPEHERAFVKFKMGPAWTPFIREVTEVIEREILEAQPTPVAAPPEQDAPLEIGTVQTIPAPTVEPLAFDSPPALPAPQTPSIDTFDERHHPVDHDQPPAGTEARRALGRRPLEERMLAAGTTKDRDELAYLVHDPDDRVFARLLENPNAPPLDIVAALRNASRERIRRVTEHRRIYALGAVKIALLHNPNTPEPVRLECLTHVSSIRELMTIIRDPRVRSLDVKSKSRTKIQDRYRAMTVDERAATIRQTGGRLLDDLWSNAYSDELTLKRLIADHGIEESLLLKIARSRTAPRSVLQAMARNPRFTGRYAVCLELALNPKTPRDAVVQLVPRLTPADRKRLKTARGVADFVSGIA